ncbi:M1 aminopeptidase [Hamiltosporidium tvaerminnensis]|uniref:M1 aminopeptidase n=1 Tax=Hamiltosporidium tvaerminnensis TaxID=1176355 RepID=A0A4Q9L133_9MICR|nr:M1 aminopeptidase [Hamiltosporidium tvaerminnensis]
MKLKFFEIQMKKDKILKYFILCIVVSIVKANNDFNFKPIDYKLYLSLSGDTDSYEGRVDILLENSEKSNKIYLNSNKSTITEIHFYTENNKKHFIWKGILNTKKLDFDIKIDNDDNKVFDYNDVFEDDIVNYHEPFKLIPTLIDEKLSLYIPSDVEPSSNSKLIIMFNNKIHHKPHGFYKTYIDKEKRNKYQDIEGENKIYSTQFQPSYARNVFPCFDHPSIKSHFTLILRIPKYYTALSNTQPHQILIGKKYKKVFFNKTEPLPTYLLAFAIGVFNYTEIIIENKFSDYNYKKKFQEKQKNWYLGKNLQDILHRDKSETMIISTSSIFIKYNEIKSRNKESLQQKTATYSGLKIVETNNTNTEILPTNSTKERYITTKSNISSSNTSSFSKVNLLKTVSISNINIDNPKTHDFTKIQISQNISTTEFLLTTKDFINTLFKDSGTKTLPLSSIDFTESKTKNIEPQNINSAVIPVPPIYQINNDISNKNDKNTDPDKIPNYDSNSEINDSELLNKNSDFLNNKVNEKNHLYESITQSSNNSLTKISSGNNKNKEPTNAHLTVRFYIPTAYKLSDTFYGISIAKKCIKYFLSQFKIALKTEKIDFLGIPNFEDIAMENDSLIIFRLEYLLYNSFKDSFDHKKEVGDTICHEISHHWFGNLVTCKDWSDLWLNEGFATYYSNEILKNWTFFSLKERNKTLKYDSKSKTHIVRIKGKFENEDKTFLSKIKEFWKSSLSKKTNLKEKTTQRFYSPPNNTPDVNNYEYYIIYNKAALILRMLEVKIGKLNFKKRIGRYLFRNKGRNADLNNFLEFMRDSQGMIVEWLEKKHFPLIRVKEENKHLIFSQETYINKFDDVESNCSSETDIEKIKFKFKKFKNKIIEETEKNIESLWEIPLILHLNNKTITFLLNDTSLKILPDKENNNIDSISKGYYVPSYGMFRILYDDDSSYNSLIMALKNNLLNSEDQINLLSDYFDFIVNYGVDLEKFFNIIIFINNNDPHVLEKAIMDLKKLKSIFYKENGLQQKVKNVITYLLKDIKPNTDETKCLALTEKVINNEIEILKKMSKKYTFETEKKPDSNFKENEQKFFLNSFLSYISHKNIFKERNSKNTINSCERLSIFISAVKRINTERLFKDLLLKYDMYEYTKEKEDVITALSYFNDDFIFTQVLDLFRSNKISSDSKKLLSEKITENSKKRDFIYEYMIFFFEDIKSSTHEWPDIYFNIFITVSDKNMMMKVRNFIYQNNEFEYMREEIMQVIKENNYILESSIYFS